MRSACMLERPSLSKEVSNSTTLACVSKHKQIHQVSNAGWAHRNCLPQFLPSFSQNRRVQYTPTVLLKHAQSQNLMLKSCVFLLLLACIFVPPNCQAQKQANAIRGNFCALVSWLGLAQVFLLQIVRLKSNNNNDINPINVSNVLSGGAVVCPYLSGTGPWFITTNAQEGLIWQEREGLDIWEDNDADTRNFKVGAYERYTFLWVNPRGLYGSNAA